MKRNQFLAIFLLCLISSHGVIGTTEKIKASVLHRELSGLAHGFSSVSQHVDKVSSLDMSKVPTDRYGNYLIAYPDENGEIQDSKADLFDPENQAKVVAFLKGAAWNGRTSRTSEWGSDDVALSTDAEWGCACETNPTGWYCKNWCATKSKVGQIGSDISEGVSSTWDRVTGRDVTRSAEEMARAEARLDALNDGTHISILEIIGAIAFGLINGMLLGMGDLFRDTFRAMRDDPNCSEPAAAVGRAFKAALHHAGQFFKGMFVSSARRCNNGAACDLGDFLREKTTSFFNAVGDVFVSFKDMCLLCRPLQSLFFAIVTIILIAIIVNVVLFLFPGLGLLVKIIGTVLTLIFGIAFLIKTAKKFLAAINDPSKQGSINLIESVCEFIGFIIAVFVLSGAGEAKKMPDMKRKFESQGLSRKGKVEWTGESQAKLTTLETTVKSAKEGKSITTEINTLRRTTTVDRSVTANSRTGSVRTTTSTNVVDDVTKTTIETTRSRVRTNLRDVGKMIEGRFVKGPGATFNPKSGRWHGPDGRFVKQPVNVWPKWNAKAGRWYNEKGQFTKSPFDANIKWDARPQVQRFRNQETGRFAKTPENPFYMIDEVAHTKVTITHETRLNSASTLTGEVYVFPPSTGPRTIPTSINIPYVVFSDADIARASSDGTDDGSSTIPPPPPAAEEETQPTESEEPAPAGPSPCERLTPVAGVCGTPSSCMGSIRPRLCPGSSSNVCCVPVADAPPADRPTDQQEADDSQAPVVPQTPTQQRADDSVIPVTPRRESQQQQQSAPATQQQASAGEETFAVPTEFSKN